MEANLTYILPDEQDQLIQSLHASNYLYALRSFDQQLSITIDLAKDGNEELKSQLDTINWIQDLFRTCCATHNALIWSDNN